MRVVIPMAGRGKRFKDAGYSVPKPLITIYDMPMIELVVNNLKIKGEYIFVCHKEHYTKYKLENLLTSIKPNCRVLLVDKITGGQASTVLVAKDFINNDDELVISNTDELVKWNSQLFLSFMRENNADGGVVTFNSTNPKWSFVKINDNGDIVKVEEKKPISNIATAGIYYFKKGKFFVEAAEKMIEKNIRTNNEFYVAPTYNEMISDGKKILSYPIAEMHGLGTPEDVDKFVKNPSFKNKDYESF